MACIKKTSCFCVIFLALSAVCSQYCCDRSRTSCGYRCIGEPCIIHNHCGRSEYCCKGTCALTDCPFCSSEEDCTSGEFCCGVEGAHGRKCAKSCVEISCTSALDCASGEYCDGDEKKCVSTHVEGNLCYSDGDCGHGHCCVFNVTRKIKRCFTSCIEQPCNSTDDCSTGQCCDEDRKCKSTRNCDTESKRRWKLVVSVGIPVAVIVIIAIAWLYHVIISSNLGTCC